MTGTSVGAPVAVHGSRVAIRIGSWTSGLYFARLAAHSGIGYAPFIVRAASAGESDVAVVLPTNTWEAYNFLDEDRNGFGDTWYADPRVDTVRFDRPFLNRGVPPHLGSFPYWVWLYGKHADYLADDDLDAASSADALARLYKLIIFAGHAEYVTSREFDLMSRYRDLGGNLAFLSANNFYARVVRTGEAIRCTGHFRDIGRPRPHSSACSTWTGATGYSATDPTWSPAPEEHRGFSEEPTSPTDRASDSRTASKSTRSRPRHREALPSSRSCRTSSGRAGRRR
jgi:hypothetical protein